MKGFISITILTAIALSVVVLGGGGYGVYKYQEVQKENQEIKKELDQQKDEEIARLEDELNVLKKEDKESEEVVTTPKAEKTVVAKAPVPQPVVQDSPSKYVPVSNKSQYYKDAVLVIEKAISEAERVKRQASMNIVISQVRVSDAQENIDFGKGYIKVYPNLKSLISYFENLYEQQIDFEQQSIDYAEAVKAYSDVIINGGTTMKSGLSTGSDAELKETTEFFLDAQLVMKENETGLVEWSTATKSFKAQIEGTVAAAQAKNSSAGLPSKIIVEVPQVQSPIQSNSFKCFSEGFIGGTLTTCN